jgi:SAM-dependent methyltransferase
VRDQRTVGGFGHEWSRFDQTSRSREELEGTFSQYFAIFPWDVLPRDAIGLDLGAGSGRWAAFVSERVGVLYCVDASEAALRVAARNLVGRLNCRFVLASAGELPFAEERFDFGYSLGVLHHVPDTLAALRDCVTKLKPGAPLLLYLYYALDNRPAWYRGLWRVTDLSRRVVSSLPPRPRYWISQVVAALMYYPLARLALGLENLGVPVGSMPLSAYRRKSFYAMRTDALDRLGTSFERRFTAEQIEAMMRRVGLERVLLKEGPPYWCAIGYRKLNGG